MREFILLAILTLVFVIGSCFLCYVDSGALDVKEEMTEEEYQEDLRKFSEELDKMSICPGKSNYEYFHRHR